MKTPSLIYEDIDVLERTLRDYLDMDIHRIILNERLKERVLNYCSENTICNGVIYEPGDLFEKYGLKGYPPGIKAQNMAEKWGYLIIDETEAMTVIDVNSGKYTGKDDSRIRYRINRRLP